LLDLDPKKRIIDPSKPSLVYCHEGYRATTATSILLRESAGNVGILIDGVEGWLALGLALETANTK
jgi:rhodanese-related sulfurtransferase